MLLLTSTLTRHFRRDLDAIESMGNTRLVDTELAISTRLSSVTTRDICPNFVVTRETFTCRHEPLEQWDFKDQAPMSKRGSHNTQPGK